MRWAIHRSHSGLMIPSASATTYQEGCSRHAGGPDLNAKRAASAGPWTAAMTRASTGWTSCANSRGNWSCGNAKKSILVDYDVLCGFQRGKATDEVRGPVVSLGRERRDVY